METKFNRNKIIQDLVATAIDNVTQHSIKYFEGNEEETIEKETEFEYNGDVIGYIEYQAYSQCTYKGRITDYYEIPDQDEYEFFYEEINVRIINEKEIELTNLSEAVNLKLYYNKRRQIS